MNRTWIPPLLGGMTLLFSGCGKNLLVAVRHPPLENLELQAQKSLESPYLVIRIPDAAADLRKGHKASQKSALSSRINGAALGEAVMARFARQGKAAAGFQIADLTQNTTDFTSSINPSGILETHLNPVHLETEKKEVQEKEQTVIHWRSSARLNGKLRPLDAQGNTLASFRSFEASWEMVLPDEPQNESWFKKNNAKLWEAAAEKIAKPFETSDSFRGKNFHRSILASKTSPRVTEGFEAAKAGDWSRAQTLWQEAAKIENHCIALHNLAAYEEKEGRFDQALNLYRQAKSSYESGKEKAKGYWYLFPDTWNAAIEDLERISEDKKLGSASLHGSRKTGNWFKRKIAVLPLANQSNFVDAPEMLRRLLHERLKRQGYALVELSDAESALHALGLTDGGQLPAFPPSQIAEALKADLLLYGTIEAFNEIPLGVYHKRELAIALKLTDAAGSAVWERRQKLIYEAGAKDNEGGRFILQLAKGLWERFKKVPLKEESAELVAWMLSFLPSKFTQ